MKILVIVIACLGGILLFLLASASANTAFFASHYPWLLALNAAIEAARALMAQADWQAQCLQHAGALQAR